MSNVTRLQRGDSIPHFKTQTVTGEVFDYSTIWQRRNLVLVALPATASTSQYAASSSSLGAEFNARDSVLVVTHEPVAGLPNPGALVADRWGEIVHVASPDDVADLPTPQELLDWIEHVAVRCPECEGETR